ncbi:MAG: nucleotidyl transferase AbiEii/AbiGii toxin family protein [Candidatus Helarchaeota archaeon]
MVDLQIIRHLAIKTGLGINFISKDNKITELITQLRELFKTKKVILKGGTAINRVYFQEAKRFSEDIDLDYISTEKLNDKIEFIKQQMKKIKNFDLDKQRLMHRTLRFDCRYTNEFGQKDLVRCEFYLALNNLVAAKRPREELLKSSLESTRACTFTTYSLEDILARKLLALHERNEGKDIYDVYYLLDLKVDGETLKKALRLIIDAYHENISIRIFFNEIVSNLDEAEENSNYIGNSTNHYLPKSFRPNWKEFINSLKLKILEIRKILL